MPSIGTIVVLAIVLLPYVGMIILAYRGDARRRKHIDAIRRTEIFNGREYSVYTLEHPLVREKSTGRIGIVIESGSQPGWVRIQFVRKTDGEPGRVEWRRFEKFERVGTADMDYLSRRLGRFRTEQLTRYRVNVSDLGKRYRPKQ